MIVTVMVAILATGPANLDRPVARFDAETVEVAQDRSEGLTEIGTIAAATQVGGESGLPERVPPPRTMRDYWPVFALFSIVWLGIVGYVLTFNGKLKRMASQLGDVPGGGPGEGRP